MILAILISVTMLPTGDSHVYAGSIYTEEICRIQAARLNGDPAANANATGDAVIWACVGVDARRLAEWSGEVERWSAMDR